jgi:hypothetical protein
MVRRESLVIPQSRINRRYIELSLAGSSKKPIATLCERWDKGERIRILKFGVLTCGRETSQREIFYIAVLITRVFVKPHQRDLDRNNIIIFTNLINSDTYIAIYLDFPPLGGSTLISYNELKYGQTTIEIYNYS